MADVKQRSEIKVRIKGVFYPSIKTVEPLLNDYGCLHYKIPVILGVSQPAYSERELAALKEKDNHTLEFEGKRYTGYEAKQTQRQIETAIRKQKDLSIIAGAAGDKDLQLAAQEKINLLANKYAKFSKAAELPTRVERLWVPSRTESAFMARKITTSFGKINLIKHTDEELAELRKYATSKGIRFHREQKFAGDIELLKEQIDVLHQLKKEYKYEKEIVIMFENMQGLDFAETTKNGNIIFNNFWLADRKLTNDELQADNILAATDIRGIAAHEFGHVLQHKHGEVGIDIFEEVYYNIHEVRLTEEAQIKHIRKEVSKYSTRKLELFPEILSKHTTNPDVFTEAFIKYLKKRWDI